MPLLSPSNGRNVAPEKGKALGGPDLDKITCLSEAWVVPGPPGICRQSPPSPI